MTAPAGVPRTEGGFVKVAISSSGSPYASWSEPVDVFFRYRAGEWQFVGFDRLPHGN